MPVVRVYGPLDAADGAQCVLNVTGAFPYLYVPLPAAARSPTETAAQLATELEAKLQQVLGVHRASRAFVKDVRPCRAVDFYGYSPHFAGFLKVRLLSPSVVRRAVDALLGGAVLGRVWQPYEAHIPFLLAFLADYNLAGCGWLEFDEENATLVGGELWLSARFIKNRMRAAQSMLHTQLFERPSDDIGISSLAAVRAQDTEWRAQVGMPPWTPLNMRPQFQTRSRDWPWVQRAEAEHELLLHLRSHKDEMQCGPQWPDLPTACELVPSVYPVRDADATENSQGNTQVSQDVLSLCSTESDSAPVARAPVVTSASALNMASLCSTESELAGASPTLDVPYYSALSIPGSSHPAAGLDIGPGDARKEASERRNNPSATNAARLGSINSPIESSLSEVAAAKNGENELAAGNTTNGLPITPDRGLLVASSEPAHLRSQHAQQSPEPPPFAPSQTQINAAADLGVELISSWSPSTEDAQHCVGITQPKEPFYSNRADLEPAPLVFANEERIIKSHDPCDLPAFYMGGGPHVRTSRGLGTWVQLASPLSPSTNDVLKGPPPAASSDSLWQATLCTAGSLESQADFEEEMTTLIVEVLPLPKLEKSPLAATDPICAVFWQLQKQRGVIATKPLPTGAAGTHQAVDTEMDLLEALVALVRRLNPDILAGYEINKMSWGYCRERFLVLTESDAFYTKLGRPVNFDGFEVVSETVLGRHMFNLWTIFRKEVTLGQYTLENMVLHVFRETTPKYSFGTLVAWWQSEDYVAVNCVVDYFFGRLAYSLKLLAHLEVIDKTCEMARIVGVDFFSSLTRGSQFQVESILCRLARRENYVLLSPTKEQVAKQNALEFIPLVMEPMQRFYTDPVCVLDFRSLYPSLVIAYNLCYSTCLGRITGPSEQQKSARVGVRPHFPLNYALLARIGLENVYIAPNKMVYVSPKVRRSLLAQMLGELLDTRFMLQSSRKHAGNTKRRLRNLHNQQLAMKFIANVTYGYTSASFSGRMPLCELADSIVLAGREILQFSIDKIESSRFGSDGRVAPEVVYGDTDSLFVRLPGVSKAQAFELGTQLAQMVTQATPEPVLLKLEKVYLPCMLLSKKRYVGRSFESADGPPKFDAKGTETIRRDGVRIVQRLEERALQILFDTSDLSQVKRFLQHEWRKILAGDVCVQDFCFQQQVRLGSYKNASNMPGGAVVSLRRMQNDAGSEPQYKERVPYVVVAGAPGTRLGQRSVHPEELLRGELHGQPLALDADYYILKAIIPPLERLFGMTGANVRRWFTAMPKVQRRVSANTPHFANASCTACLARPRAPGDVFCTACRQAAPRAAYTVAARAHLSEQKLGVLRMLCTTCSGRVPPESFGSGYDVHPCQSLDCRYYYEREGVLGDVRSQEALQW